MDEEQDIYEVDIILDARFADVYPFKPHCVQIKWEGYTEEESTWEKIGHLSAPLETYNLSDQLKEKVKRIRLRRSVERAMRKRTSKEETRSTHEGNSSRPSTNVRNSFGNIFRRGTSDENSRKKREVNEEKTFSQSQLKQNTSSLCAPRGDKSSKSNKGTRKVPVHQKEKPSMDSNFPEFPDFPVFPPFPKKQERPDADLNKKRPATWKAEHVGQKEVINLASDSDSEQRTPAASVARAEPPPTQESMDKPKRQRHSYKSPGQGSSKHYSAVQSNTDTSALELVESGIRVADEAFHKGDYAVSKRKISEVLQKVSSTNANVRCRLQCRLAAIKMREGDYQGVITMFAEPVWRIYDSHRWMLMQALWYRSRNNADVEAIIHNAQILREPLLKSIDIIAPYADIPSPSILKKIRDSLKHILQLKSKAEQLYLDGEFSRAIPVFAEAIRYEEGPDGSAPTQLQAKLYAGLAAAQYRAGMFHDAILNCCRAQGLCPALVEPYFCLCSTLSDLGFFKAALEVCEDCLSIDTILPADKNRMRETRSKVRAMLSASNYSQNAFKLVGLNPTPFSLNSWKARNKQIMMDTHPDKVPQFCKRLSQYLGQKQTNGGQSHELIRDICVCLSKRLTWSNHLFMSTLGKINAESGWNMELARIQKRPAHNVQSYASRQYYRPCGTAAYY